MLAYIYRLYFSLRNIELLCIHHGVACVYDRNKETYDFYFLNNTIIPTYFHSSPSKLDAIFSWRIHLNGWR